EVSDEQLARAAARFPVQPPKTKEEYVYRAIFESWYPGEAAARCVPEGMSIACSTPTALEWDASFRNNADPSGRSVLGVHADGAKMTGGK
ncbi:MAG: asparagine synthase B, partial [Planctomycetes bacterium]|nr:asparagine synthase B [Planctomycetota bacterium]